MRASVAPDAEPQACEARYQGLRPGFIPIGGEASGYTAAEPLMEIPIAAPKALRADRGHDGNRFRESLVLRGVLPIVRRARGARCPSIPTIAAAGTRNRVERMFGKARGAAPPRHSPWHDWSILRERPRPCSRTPVAHVFRQHGEVLWLEHLRSC